VWKSSTCGCCKGWATYLQHNGYMVVLIDVDNIDLIKRGLGVPGRMQTAKIGGYVVEGHVPVEAIDKMLSKWPKVTGIASPGMPSGSPGMDGPKEDNIVHSFGSNGSRVFGKY